MLHNLSMTPSQELDGSRKIITKGFMKYRRCLGSLTWNLHLALVGNCKYVDFRTIQLFLVDIFIYLEVPRI